MRELGGHMSLMTLTRLSHILVAKGHCGPHETRRHDHIYYINLVVSLV